MISPEPDNQGSRGPGRTDSSLRRMLMTAASSPWVGLYLPALVMPVTAFGKTLWVSWLIAAATLIACYGRPYRWPPLKNSFAAALGALLALALVSLAWAHDPGDGVLRFLRLAGCGLCGAILVERARQMPAHRAAAGLFIAGLGLAVGLGAILLEVASGFPVSGLWLKDTVISPGRLPVYYNSFATVMAVTVPAIAGLGWERWGPKAGALLLLCVAPIFLLNSSAALIAAGAGLAAAAGVWVMGRKFIAATAVALSLLALTLPPLAGVQALYNGLQDSGIHLPFSAAHRLVIWRFTASKISEKPVAGWGIGASGAIPGNTDARTLPGYRELLQLSGSLSTYPTPLMASHPHNLILQVRLELGWPGAILLALIFLTGGRAFAKAKLKRREMAGAAASAAVAVTVYMFSYNAWNAWWLSTLIFVAVFVTAFRIRNI